MDEKLLIVGAEQYGQLVKEIVMLNTEYREVTFVDDNSSDTIGRISDLEVLIPKWKYAIVAIGNAEIRKKVTDKLSKLGYCIVNAIHPCFYISSSAKLGRGCVVELWL